MSAPEKILTLQYVRAFAALWVMIFHYTLGLIPDSLFTRSLYMVVSHGYLGVDIFFVLSGYIVSYTYTYRKNTLIGFLAMRYARIYVGFIPILMVYLLCLEFADIPFTGSFAKSLLLIKQPIENTPIAVIWTLHCELSFYCMFVLVALLPIKRKHILIIGCVSILILMHCYLAIIVIDDSLDRFNNFWGRDFRFSFIKQVLLPYTIEFCAGVALFFYAPRIPHTLWMSLIAFIAFLTLEYVFFNDMNALQQAYYVFYRVMAALPFAMLLILAAIQTNQTSRGCISHVAERLGDASYALYLLHFPVLKLGRHINDGMVSPMLLILCCSITTIILSVYWSRYIEKPLLHLSKRAITKGEHSFMSYFHTRSA